MSIHNVVIIPVSSDPLNLQNVEREKALQKIEYLENENSFLDKIQIIFIIYEMFSLGEIDDISFKYLT